MSKNGSKKEFIFTLILQRNSHLLSPFLGGVELLELEHDSKKRIDIYGRDGTHNSPVYIESQLGCSDDEHYKKLESLVDTNSNKSGYFIWIATRFTEKYLVKMENLFKQRIVENKHIKILALSLQDEYLEVLNKLNQQKDLDIWTKINQDGFVLPKLNKIDQWGYIPPGFVDSAFISPNYQQKLTSTEEINSYLLSTLRKEVPYLLNVHRSKTLSVNPIVIGSGYSDISFVINLAASEVVIRLEHDWQSPLYQEVVSQFKGNRDFHTAIFEDEKVVFPILELDDPQEKVEMATKLFKAVVDVAIPVIYSQRKSSSN